MKFHQSLLHHPCFEWSNIFKILWNSLNWQEYLSSKRNQWSVYFEHYLRFILEFGKDEDIAEEEKVSVLGLRAFRDLHTLVQQQLPVFAGEAEDEGTLLHGHPARSFLSGAEDTHKRR